METSHSVTDWETLIGALPLLITELDPNLCVLRQFNAGDSPLACQHGETFLAEHSDQLAAAFVTGGPIRFETAYTTDNTRHYAHVVQRSADAETLVISSTDVTEQVTSRQENLFYRRVLDTIDMGVSVFNFDMMQTTYVNDYKVRLHGKPLDDIPEHHYLGEIHPDDISESMTYGLGVIRNLGDHDVATKEYRIVDGRGATRWVMVRDQVFTRSDNGRVVENLGVMVDITARKALEEELTRIKHWFDAIMDRSGDAIAISTIGERYDDSKFVTGNRRLEELTGYSLDELRTMKASDLLADSDKPKANDRHRRRLRSTDPVNLAEGLGRRKDGTEFPFESLAVAVYDESGNRTEQINFVRDITERKAYENTLRDARIKAESALRARDAFIANMSHELRSPLNTIQGYAQLILEEADIAPQVAWSLQLIDYSAEHLSRLIDDVLDLSRIEAGFDTLHPTTFDLRYLCERLQGILEVHARRKDLYLNVLIDDSLPPVIRLDEVKLKQIIINLVDNAIKYTDAGGVDLTFRLDDNETLHCIVTDTGHGIPEQSSQHLMHPYERDDDRLPGTGLGLAITQRLVTLMGGMLDIQGEAGQGTTVSVRLPVETPQAIAMTPAHVTSVHAGRPHRLIVIDDPRDDSQVLVEFLTRHGFTVDVVDSGVAALNVIDDGLPNLVFVDLRMPGTSGVETIQRIRECNAEVPCIGITADATLHSRQRLLDAGCNEVITKPYRLTAIAQILLRYLDVQVETRPSHPPPARKESPATPSSDLLAELPQDWLTEMYALCMAGNHDDALPHVALIEADHPAIAAQFVVLIHNYWTSAIADAIKPLVD